VPAGPCGHRFQALAQLIDFNGQGHKGQCLSAMEALFLDQSTQLGMPVEVRPG
jgi:hypothetical protein